MAYTFGKWADSLGQHSMRCFYRARHLVDKNNTGMRHSGAVALFWPKYRLGQTENDFFYSLKKHYLDQSIQQNILFNFENRSTAMVYTQARCLQSVLPFQPEHRLGHPEKYLFLSSEKHIYRSKISTNKLI